MKKENPVGALVLLALATAWGCTSIGPRTIVRDRFDYSEAMSASVKEQMLLNVVRLRYADPPLFIDVSSIINQYSLEGELNGSLAWSDGISDNVQSLGGRVRYGDRPTITYSPLLGQEFTKSLMTPLPPGSILFLVQSGWAVDIVFRVTVQAINGVYNQAGSPALGRGQADEGWDEVVSAMRRIQLSGAIGMRVEDPERPESALMVIRRREEPETLADLEMIQSTLRLSPDVSSYRLIYGADATADDALAVQTRSVFEIMAELASAVYVPEEHIEQGRTYRGLLPPEDPTRLIHIYSGLDLPTDAFVSVRYRDHWFWIEDTDIASKRVFAFLMILYNVTQTSGGMVPLLTVPT